MPPKFDYVYELRSINLANLPQKEQAVVLERFAGFLNALSEPAALRILKDERTVEALGATYQIPYARFFVSSPMQVDSLIGSLVGTNKFVRVPSIPDTVGVSHVGKRYLVDADSNFVQTYNVTRLGGSLPAGFLTRLYSLAHSIKIDVVPIEVYAAKRLSRERARALQTELNIRAGEGRFIDPEDQITLQRVQAAAELIAAGAERLFRLRISIVLREKTHDELASARIKLKQALGGIVDEIDSPRFLQLPLLTGNGPGWAAGRWFFVTTAGATAMFPFAGLDIIDPNGTFLGQNLQTGNAIIYDVFDKDNYNLALIGSTGAGKSSWIKSTFSRMLAQDKSMFAYVFDSIVKPEYSKGPDGRYETSFAGVTGCAVHEFSREKGAGLDPFAVFTEKRHVTNFLASVAKIEDEPGLVADLNIAAEKVSNVSELLQSSSGELKKRLAANLPLYRFLFEGEMEVYPRMVFVLYNLPAGELRDAAAFLALSAVWKQIQMLPVSAKKAIVIDEGWSLVEVNPRTGRSYFPLAVEYVPTISRTGRHYNTSFCIATQLATDLLGRGNVYGPGRAMIESCATKVVLHQDHAAAETVREAFDLSEKEERFVVSAKVGQGLLLTAEGHIPFYNHMSDLEQRIFTTKPKEVTA